MSKSGRINSEGSLRTAQRVFRHFNGDWLEAARVAERDDDGVYVVRLSKRSKPPSRPSAA